ncbi:MAG: hypothetical protein J1D77_07175 [Muribaculaceae bacterium]|nr:hypothetical protein [Muribaculaceae bacterium]
MRTKKLAKETATDVVKMLKAAHKKLKNVAALTPKEQAKLVAVLDSVKDTIDNFDRKKKEQLLDSYRIEQQQLAKRGEDLASKIEQLQNELN